MHSATSVAPWQPICCYYPIPNSQIRRLILCDTPKFTSCKALNHQTKSNHHIIYLFSPSATTRSSCSKHQENKKPTSYPHQDHSLAQELHSSKKAQTPQKLGDKEDVKNMVLILTSRWWADFKAALGQSINLQGLSCSVGVFTKERHLVVPHVAVPDIRHIDWAELKRRGFQGVVFDKDNTITVPYSLGLWRPLSSSVEECKSVFGNNIAVFSNSAGLHEYDPDGRKARALEFKIGIKVIRHMVKKPAGLAEEIERQLGCKSSRLIMVGDRPFTDIVYGNRNGFLTILTNPLSLAEEPFIVRQVRKLEIALVNQWSKKGIKPTDHRLLPDLLECVKDL